MTWHKLYSGARRVGNREKAAKDRQQGATLAAILADDQPGALEEGWRHAPRAMRQAIRLLQTSLLEQLAPHPAARAVVARCLK
jgi:hypothetical protein